MIIDAHQHFWKYNSVRDTWIDDSMEVIRKDFLPLDLAPILKANDVDGCIAVQADQSEAETQFLLDLARQNPFIKGVIGWVDLQNNNIEERLAYFSKNALFKGVRHIIQGEPKGFMLQDNFLNGISKLAQFHLVFEILIYPNQLKETIEMVKKFPNQKFILNHIGKPKISQIIDIKWTKNIKELASFKNVYCKLSGLVTETDNFKWKYKDFNSFLYVVFNAFSPKRLLFGSDWPVCLLAASYEEVYQIIKRYTANLSEKERENILGSNAVDFYNLKTSS